MDVHWSVFDGEECYDWDIAMDVMPRIGDEIRFMSETRGSRRGRVTDVTWYLPDDDEDEIAVTVFARSRGEDSGRDAAIDDPARPSATAELCAIIRNHVDQIDGGIVPDLGRAIGYKLMIKFLAEHDPRSVAGG